MNPMMSVIACCVLFLGVIRGEDATIPYSYLYDFLREYPINLSFKLTCGEAAESPLVVTIRHEGAVTETLKLAEDGGVRIPVNETWAKDGTVIHANRPKGTMTLGIRFSVYPLEILVNKQGVIELNDLLKRVEWAKAQIPRIKKLFHADIEFNITGVFTVRARDGAPFSIDMECERDGVRSVAKTSSVDGKMVLDLSAAYGASQALLRVSSANVRLLFDDYEIRHQGSDDVVP